MKSEIKFTVFVIFLFIFAATASKAQDALPTLRGAAAVEKLKQTGQYDGLMETFRKASGRTEEPATENLMSQTAKLTAADGGSGSWFGRAVAISGNTAIIGGTSGAAYIFVRSGTTWMQQQKLVASDGTSTDLFGYGGVSIDGDTAVVGAPGANIGGNNYQGAAYVFVRNGGIWTEQQKIFASDGAYGNDFGRAVVINGNTIAASSEAGTVGATGVVYVFVRSGTVWTAQQKLVSSDGQPGGNFGQGLALEDNTLVVGAPYNTQCGSVYVFVRIGTRWREQQKLNAADRLPNDTFGASDGVDISGDTIVVGARWSLGARGSAYVFVRSGAAWTEQQKLTAAEGVAGDFLGAVAISGNTIIAGAPSKDFAGEYDRGAAYLFVRSGTVWTEQQRLSASDGGLSDWFGGDVAIEGNKIIVGAQFANVGSNPDQGAAYSYVAAVSVRGRVTNASGYGIANALVQMTNAAGSRLFARTSAFGYYQFDNVEADQTVTVVPISKTFQFIPQTFSLTGNITDLNFVAQ